MPPRASGFRSTYFQNLRGNVSAITAAGPGSRTSAPRTQTIRRSRAGCPLPRHSPISRSRSASSPRSAVDRGGGGRTRRGPAGSPSPTGRAPRPWRPVVFGAARQLSRGRPVHPADAAPGYSRTVGYASFSITSSKSRGGNFWSGPSAGSGARPIASAAMRRASGPAPRIASAGRSRRAPGHRWIPGRAPKPPGRDLGQAAVRSTWHPVHASGRPAAAARAAPAPRSVARWTSSTPYTIRGMWQETQRAPAPAGHGAHAPPARAPPPGPGDTR